MENVARPPSAHVIAKAWPRPGTHDAEPSSECDRCRGDGHTQVLRKGADRAVDIHGDVGKASRIGGAHQSIDDLAFEPQHPPTVVAETARTRAQLPSAPDVPPSAPQPGGARIRVDRRARPDARTVACAGPSDGRGLHARLPRRGAARRHPQRDFLHLYGPGACGCWPPFSRCSACRCGPSGPWASRSNSRSSARAMYAVVFFFFFFFFFLRPWGRRVAVGGRRSPAGSCRPPALTAWRGSAGSRSGCGRCSPRSAAGSWRGAAGRAALLYRPDLSSPSCSASRCAVDGLELRQRKRLLAGSALGLSPYLVHIALAGPGHAFFGMVLQPVFQLRGGRRLPLPPSWSHFDGFLQHAGELTRAAGRSSRRRRPASSRCGCSCWCAMLADVLVVLAWRRPAQGPATLAGRARCSSWACSASGCCRRRCNGPTPPISRGSARSRSGCCPSAIARCCTPRSCARLDAARAADRRRGSHLAACSSSWCRTSRSDVRRHGRADLRQSPRVVRDAQRGPQLLLRTKRRGGCRQRDAPGGRPASPGRATSCSSARATCARRPTARPSSTTCCPQTRPAPATSRWIRASPTGTTRAWPTISLVRPRDPVVDPDDWTNRTHRSMSARTQPSQVLHATSAWSVRGARACSAGACTSSTNAAIAVTNLPAYAHDGRRAHLRRSGQHHRAPALADSGQMHQVLMNLSINARDAMPEGGTLFIETSNVDLSATSAGPHANMQAGPHVQLEVRDTGSGMTKEVMSHLFEPFFTTKKVGMGTGLGLATVYGIVKQTGGSIRVDNHPPKEPPSPSFSPYGRPRRSRIRVSPGGAARHRNHPRRGRPGSGPHLAVRILKIYVPGSRSVRCERPFTTSGNHSRAFHLLLTDVVMRPE